MNWREQIRGNPDFGMIIDTYSIDTEVNADFKYIDLGAEVQFIVLELIRNSYKLVVDDIRDLLGLTDKIVSNITTRMKNNNLLKDSGLLLELTDEGSTIKRKEDIITRENVEFYAEIAPEIRYFIGNRVVSDEEFEMNDQVLNVLSDLDLLQLCNLPENLEAINLTENEILGKHELVLRKWDNSQWEIESETGTYIRIEEECGLEDQNILHKLISTNKWINHCKLTDTGFSVSKQNTSYLISAASLHDLERHVQYYENKFYLRLEVTSNNDWWMVRKVNLTAEDELSERLLFFMVLQDQSEKFWLGSVEEMTDKFQKIWDNLGNQHTIPSRQQLVDLAFENNNNQLLIKFRALGDIIEGIY